MTPRNGASARKPARRKPAAREKPAATAGAGKGAAAIKKQAAAFRKAHPGIHQIEAFFADLSGVIRGKRYGAEDLEKLLGEGVALPGSVFLLDSQGECHDAAGRGFSDGDPDAPARAVPGTLQPVPWAPDLGQVLLTFDDDDGSPYPFDPRNVLARTAARVTAMGYRPAVALELEFYLIDRERLGAGAPQPPVSPKSGRRLAGTQVYGLSDVDDFAVLLEDMRQACHAQDVPVGPISAEYAPGQFEINLHHVEDPILAADHAVLLKRIVKSMARQHGVEATFMAKPYLETAGSGLHMHLSLLDARGRNIFDGGKSGPHSREMLWAMGGILDLLPEAMALLAPNANSYRRFQPNIYVPVGRSWAPENRSVALRIPRGGPEARRFEHRVGGADANPYLALATVLAGLHHGLTNRIDPPPPAQGNAGAEIDPAMPLRLRAALDRLEDSAAYRDYLGADFVEAYVACKRAEQDAFESAISSREYDWYLASD